MKRPEFRNVVKTSMGIPVNDKTTCIYPGRQAEAASGRVILVGR